MFAGGQITQRQGLRRTGQRWRADRAGYLPVLPASNAAGAICSAIAHQQDAHRRTGCASRAVSVIQSPRSAPNPIPTAAPPTKPWPATSRAAPAFVDQVIAWPSDSEAQVVVVDRIQPEGALRQAHPTRLDRLVRIGPHRGEVQIGHKVEDEVLVKVGVVDVIRSARAGHALRRRGPRTRHRSTLDPSTPARSGRSSSSGRGPPPTGDSPIPTWRSAQTPAADRSQGTHQDRSGCLV